MACVTALYFARRILATPSNSLIDFLLGELMNTCWMEKTKKEGGWKRIPYFSFLADSKKKVISPYSETMPCPAWAQIANNVLQGYSTAIPHHLKYSLILFFSDFPNPLVSDTLHWCRQ